MCESRSSTRFEIPNFESGPSSRARKRDATSFRRFDSQMTMGRWNHLCKFFSRCVPFIVLLVAGSLAVAKSAKHEARVTRVIRDVKLLPSESESRPAVVNDNVYEDTAVRTGDESRSELTFVDLRITRLGANTIFTFNKAGRSVQLNTGSMLLYVPKNSGGGEMTTSAVSVAITGTTVMLQGQRSGRTKLSVLEGGARAWLIKHPRELVYVRAGQMIDVPAGATKMPQPVDIDVREAMRSPLITDFPPLPSQNVILTGPLPVYPSRPVVGQPVGGFPPLPLFPNPPGYPGRGHHPGGHGGTNVGTGSTTTGTSQPPFGGTGKPPHHPGAPTQPGTVGRGNVGGATPTPTPSGGGTVLRTVPTQPGHITGSPAGHASGAGVKSKSQSPRGKHPKKPGQP